MRVILTALALIALAACTQTNAPPPPPMPAFSLQTIAREEEQIYLVTHADGRAAAARVRGNASELMPVEEARALIDARMGVMGQEGEQQVSVALPGMTISVAGKEGRGPEDRARVAINVAGREVLVDAEGPSSANGERATVSVGGASEAEVREFLRGADHMSAETRAQMLTQLGLAQ